MKITRRKKRTYPSTIKNREMPLPYHVSNTLGANPSQLSVGDCITSTMKIMTIGGGRKVGGM